MSNAISIMDFSPKIRVFPINTADGKSVAMTFGIYSYAVEFFYWNLTYHTHILVGNCSSLARQLTFNIGRNHNYKNVTTFEFNDLKNCPPEIAEQFLLSERYSQRNQVIIGHDVWIGHGVTIMGGVKIGNGAVIGADAVVAKNIPPYAIAVGNPARVIKYRFDEETIRKLLAVKWWNWDLKKIADNFPLMTDVEKFLAVHYSPELENFPEDDFSSELEKLTGGGDIYQFIADFRALQPLWKKVIQEFIKADARARLIVWLGKNLTQEDINTLNRFGAELAHSPAISRILFVPPVNGKNFSPAALRKGTHFITNREMTTLEALDYLWDTDVKIISALDEGIFKGA